PEHLVRELEPGKDLERARLFDALFVLHAGFDSHLELPGLNMELVKVEDVPAQFGSTLSHLSIVLGEGEQGFAGYLEYAAELFEPPTIDRMLGHLEALLESAVADPGQRLSELSMLTEAERRQLATSLAGSPRLEEGPDLLALLETQAARTPDAPAVNAGDQSLTWRELRARARTLAALLVGRGAGPEHLVAVCLEPSPERLVALWAVLEAGGAWVLLAPAQLRELASLAPAGAPMPLLLTYSRLRSSVPLDTSRVLHVDALPDGGIVPSTVRRVAPAGAETMVCLEALPGKEGRHLRAIHTHRTVMHLFRVLDEGAGAGQGGAWLWAEEPGGHGAGLEVLWALSRGQRVVLAPEAASARFVVAGQAAAPRRPLDFSLSYFANDEDSLGKRKYQLLLEGAKFADARGFTAVWTPERHFHSFGGLYPSPAVVGAGLATITERLHIRAGSVVLPLHDPIQVTEEWAVVDNLSGGRVGVSFASGWHANDFVFAPDHYARRKEVLLREIETVRKLWRGGTVRRRNGMGEEVEVAIRPRPVQPELPFWLTAANSPDTFRLAGEMGANVLTNLMGQDLDGLASKVALYREAWRQHGHGPGRGHVSLMLHAFLGEDPAEIRRTVREPLLRYFRSSVDIFSGFAASQGLKVDVRTLTPKDMEALLEHGLERYLEDGGFFGTPESCTGTVERVRRLDIDEVACLVDFGVGVEATLVSLQHLDTLRQRSQPSPAEQAALALHESGAEASALLALVRDAGATHLHCTPAMARALLALPGVSEVLRPVRRLLLEGATPELAASLARAASVEVVRREGTLGLGAWLPVPASEEASLAILPASTRAQFHVLDSRGQPVPTGVVGELVIGGGGVPRGFWNDPEATRTRLVPHPSAGEGTRLLVTGRRARLRADGAVELLQSVIPPPPRRPAPVAAPLQKEAPRTQAPPAIPRVPRDGALPLSFAQQRLWYLDRLEPGNVAYSNPSAMRMRGSLEPAALERALNEVARRHEVLRTTFVMEPSGPVQRIAPSPSLTLEVSRLETEGEHEAEIARWIREHSLRPFDIETGPLVRAALLRVHETEHVLLVNMHHIISDGWSAGVMLQELALLYGAFVEGRGSPLPELPVQYADYTVWQRQWLQGPELTTQLAWWKEALADLPVLSLPLDRPRPAVQTYRGARYPIAISRPLTQALAALARREKATSFMLLMAAWQLLLSRHSGQEDFAVGTALAGRNRPEIEPLVGCFVNALPVRADLSGNPSLLEVLGRVRGTTLAAFAHQEAPFEKLVEVLGVARDLSHTPIFQTMMVLHNTPMPTVELGGLTLSGMDIDTGSAKFDLMLELREGAEGLRGGIEYNTDLFEPEMVARMAGHFQKLLEGWVARPEQRLSELSLLTAEERHRLLVEWNSERAEYPTDRTIHQLFEEQVERTPEAPAVDFMGTQLTYRELNRRANQLAHHLRTLGVGQETLVGICVERSLEMVVGILGILKAGGAYVPLDPSLPAERLGYMFENAGLTVLLTQEHVGKEFPFQGTRVRLDSEWERIARRSEVNPLAMSGAGNLAYAIYTSGSTGRPKGTLLEHRGLVNTILAVIKGYDLRPESRVLQFVAFGFDVSVCDIFSTLLAGACLCLAPRDAIMPGPLLHSVLKEQGITTVQLTPSSLAILEPEGLEALETVISVGEACPPAQVARWKPGRRFLNAYGPTEVTIFATLCDDMDEQRPTIGRPLPNFELYVLDERLEPVPVGVPGELYIGGVGLARGYLGRPELTAERFIPHPFSGRPGQRLYRTGDVVRYLANGEVDFLGRRDAQVKIRGFRIELGEVEAVLLQHPTLSMAKVIVREDVPGNKRLVAYVVPEPAREADVAVLRAFLKERLPEYMVPSAFVLLEALPLNPNGKVDQRALPVPEEAQAGAGVSFVAPRTVIEEMVAGIWAQVLGLKRVSVDGNFFELGGHSLLAMQVLSRVRDTFKVDLPFRRLFEASTVAGLARSIELALEGGAGRTAPPLVPVPREGELPASFAQQRLWFLEQLQPGGSSYNVSMAMRLLGRLDMAALESSLRELIRRHEALRTTFASPGGRVVQVISPEVSLELVVEDLEGLDAPEREAEARRRVREEAQRPFDLSRGPSLRARVLRLAREEHVLMLVKHHIVTDRWSIDVLVRELRELYPAFEAGGVPELPEFRIQYADYTVWQRQWLQGEVLEAQLSYWKKTLGGAPHALELPTDRPRPQVQTFRGAQMKVQLPLALSREVRALSQREGATLFMTLLTAFQALMARYSGQRDIVVGTPIAGRNHQEVEGLIGFFVNTLALRADVRDELSFNELLAQVRETCLGAYAHQDLPFEQMVDALQLERDLSRTLLFQVMFLIEDEPVSTMQCGGLSLKPFEVEFVAAKFDLTVTLRETEQGLLGFWLYNTDLFDDETVARMAGHFQKLLEGWVARPEQRVMEVKLLTEEERRRV
ncbi:non-ribosomal peptide synthetase, partial [Archangium sp.]|uniref:non-ribosomal peptide synthetase n=1 Tax=Archangium sp. TaxID=1872627 RepID=UPI002D221336